MTKRKRGGKVPPSPSSRSSDAPPSGLPFGSVRPEESPTQRTPVQSVSSPATLTSADQPRPSFQFGSVEAELYLTPVRLVRSQATPQETGPAASEKDSTARGDSSSSRSPGQPQPPGTSPARQDSPTLTRYVVKKTDASKAGISARGNSSPPVRLQPRGTTPPSEANATPPLPPQKSPSPARLNSTIPTCHVAKLTGTSSVDCKEVRSSQWNSSSSPVQQMSPPQSNQWGSSSNFVWVPKKEQSPGCPAAAQEGEKSGSSTRIRPVKKPSASGSTAAEERDKNSPASTQDQGKSNPAAAAQERKSSSSKICPVKKPSASGLTAAEEKDKNSPAPAQYQGKNSPAPAQYQGKNSPAAAQASENSGSSTKICPVKEPSTSGPTAAEEKDKNSPAPPQDQGKSSPAAAQGRKKRGSSRKICPVKKPSASSPTAAEEKKNSPAPAQDQGKSSPAATEDKEESSPVAAEDKEKSGSASGGRYNLRSRNAPTTAGAESTDPSDSAAPPRQHRNSSLTMKNDDKAIQLYLQYLQKHEKCNAVNVLLSKEPLKLTIKFKKVLQSNRSLAHTICNKKDSLWNSLLGASRTFLLQELQHLSTRINIEAETIKNNLLELQLEFENLPANICTLQDFLGSTALTALETILEGHLVIVLTDEGRRILHTIVAYLTAHHKRGESWGGKWKPKDWDVENSRSVSLSKAPSRFMGERLPAQDLARLDKSVLPSYLTRGHLNIPVNQQMPKLLFIRSFRSDLKDRSGLTRDDYHELITSHPFLMPSEARSDFLYALYRFYRTYQWANNVDYSAVFGDEGLNDWTIPFRNGSSMVLEKIFFHKWDKTRNDLPYGWMLGHLLVCSRHALEHIRDHEKLIRRMVELELLVSSRAPGFLARLIRLLFQHNKMSGEVRRRWNIYVGSGLNERV